MSVPHATENSNLVSKVSFFPVEDRTGENKALIVTIRKVVPEGDELKRIMEVPRRSLSVDSKKKTRSSRSSSEKSKNRSTMTETSEGISLSTQTQAEASFSNTLDAGNAYLDTLCLKHAAQNISHKASHMPSEKISLCNNCSKSMLSYIFLVQDFLDSLAKEICGEADSKNCMQCLRQENRISLSSQGEEVDAKAEKKSSKSRSKNGTSRKSESLKQVSDSQTTKISISTKDTNRDVRKYEETAEKLIQRSISEHLQEHQIDSSETPFQHKSSPNLEGQKMASERRNYSHPSPGKPHDETMSNFQQSGHQEHSSSNEQHERSSYETMSNQDQSVSSYQKSDNQTFHHESKREHEPLVSQGEQLPSYQASHQQLNHPSEESGNFRKPMERQQPDFSEASFHQEHKSGEGDASNQNVFTNGESVMSPLSNELNNIHPTLTNVDRQVYDAARNGAGWESLSETQEGLISASSSHIASEAFVTMCRNNAEAMGCLVVGISLLLCRTSRTLCVVVGDGVSNAFRGPLSSVFHIVQCVRAMDSLGTTKLALLEQPELGISFDKLNVWRLTQFNKCVYLNPDTLVIQNCDELFCHDELSAVPDIGWPDCFNSGVFVFVPSIQTFWQLVEFAEKQGSYDGGDQGLLNSYFSNWSDDISKKLSFIYNLMANVSYTYTPAFRQFGRDVKIVQFHGSFKPWHVKFFSRNGQISPASTVHPTYVQFVFIWIKIFRFSALRKLSQDIQSYAQSQEVICAVELLRFFPLPTESEAEFFLTPPSVRLRLAERKLQRSTKLAEDAKRRKSAEFTPISDEVFDSSEVASPSTATGISTTKETADVLTTAETSEPAVAAATETASGDSDAPVAEIQTAKSLLPGAEIGNYQGMKAWEQGRMDYQGTDSSDTIIKRLQFLMTQPK